MAYDVTRDFIAVVPLGKTPTALIVSPSKGIKSVQELVAKAKAKPGSLTFASAGVGSTTHLTAERFIFSAGIKAIHVPFRGGGFRPEVSSGRVDFAFSPIAVAVPDVRDGRLLALAVSAQDRASGFRRCRHSARQGRERRVRAMARRVRAGENAARYCR